MTTREWYAADSDDQDRTRSDTTVWRDRGTIIAAQQARISELEAITARVQVLADKWASKYPPLAAPWYVGELRAAVLAPVQAAEGESREGR